MSVMFTDEFHIFGFELNSWLYADWMWVTVGKTYGVLSNINFRVNEVILSQR